MDIGTYFCVLLGALVVAVIKSPKAKRQIGTWLIASAEADETRREYFTTRLMRLRSHFPESPYEP